MHLLPHRSRHADAARFSQRFQPRSDIDAIARDVGAVNDDVTQVDADAELDALVGSLRLVVPAHGALHVDRATQHPVTGGLDDPTAMFGNLRIDDAHANPFKSRERSSLITFHMPAEADHIGDEDRGESTGNCTPIHGRLCDSQQR